MLSATYPTVCLWEIRVLYVVLLAYLSLQDSEETSLRFKG